MHTHAPFLEAPPALRPGVAMWQSPTSSCAAPSCESRAGLRCQPPGSAGSDGETFTLTNACDTNQGLTAPGLRGQVSFTEKSSPLPG